jgi:hypothetical protein
MATVLTKDFETATSGPVTVNIGSDTYNTSGGVQGIATNFTIGVVCTGTPAAGTLGITFNTIGGTTETLKDEFGVAITIDMTAIRSIRVTDVAATSFTFTPSGFSGITGYTVTVTGW